MPAECDAARANLDAFVDGEVDPCDAARVMAHLAACEPCRRAESALRQLIAAIERTRIPVLASRRLRLRVAQLFAEPDHSTD